MNSDRKDLFNATLSSQYVYIFSRIRRMSDEMEARFGKDIAEFTDDEAIEFLKSFRIANPNTLTGIRTLLKLYTKWCRDNGYTTAPNAYNHITREQFLSVLHYEKHVSYNDIVEIIHLLKNSSDRAFLWCLLYGINGHEHKDILNVKEKDICGNTITTISGKKVEFPDEAITDIRESCNTYKYYGSERFWKYESNDEHMLKKRYGSMEENKGRSKIRMTNKLKTINNTAGTSLTQSQIKLAGFTYFTRKIIEENIWLNSWTVFDHPDFVKVKNQYDFKENPSSIRSNYSYLIEPKRRY